ncbi:MAG: hypothetical protein D6734_10025 [Candidatus Schekmanbacteria bacterium]|nr:MAG: hypothetical protein D6734_10025 [Candidatus Schekmanbacteria bacterium]
MLMKNESEVFNNFANILEEITSVYTEFFLAIQELTLSLKKSDYAKFLESQKHLETIILKIRLLEEVRIKDVKKISELTGLDEESITLSTLIETAPPPINERFYEIKKKLSEIINKVSDSTKHTKNLLESSIVTIENTINFIKSICTSNPVYQKTGKIESNNLKSSLFAQKV